MSTSFLPDPFIVNSKDDVLPLYEQLIGRNLNSIADFRTFLSDMSELESALSEDMAWRYIRMTCDTQNKDHEAAYLTFVQEIQPHLAPLEDQINKRLFPANGLLLGVQNRKPTKFICGVWKVQ